MILPFCFRQACQIMDRGLTKVLPDHQLKGILRKLGVAASDSVLDAVCLKYRPSKDSLVGFSSDLQGVSKVGQGGSGCLVEYNRFIKDLAHAFPSA